MADRPGQGDRHRQRAIAFRPASDADRAWLLAEAERAGETVTAVLRRLVRSAREVSERAGLRL